MLLIPISVLIAVLVTFGILEKTFQLVAFKASGISLYRIVLPILAIAMALSGAMFVMQEYVLPFANQRQDNLRSLIYQRPTGSDLLSGRSKLDLRPGQPTLQLQPLQPGTECICRVVVV